MAKRPGDSEQSSRKARQAEGTGDNLDDRRKRLEASLASHRADGKGTDSGAAARDVSGIGNALRLSSEFIAGVLVGAGLGWAIDYLAGTSPWGLIIFLLLGFCAGIVNLLRSAGMMAEVGWTDAGDGDGQPKDK